MQGFELKGFKCKLFNSMRKNELSKFYWNWGTSIHFRMRTKSDRLCLKRMCEVCRQRLPPTCKVWVQVLFQDVEKFLCFWNLRISFFKDLQLKKAVISKADKLVSDWIGDLEDTFTSFKLNEEKIRKLRFDFISESCIQETFFGNG